MHEREHEEIRIGVVGIGHLGGYHLQKYLKIPDCRIVGVADMVEENARKAADGCDCEVLTDYRGASGNGRRRLDRRADRRPS